MLVKTQNGFLDSRKPGSSASKLFVSGDPSLLINDCPESGNLTAEMAPNGFIDMWLMRAQNVKLISASKRRAVGTAMKNSRFPTACQAVALRRTASLNDLDVPFVTPGQLFIQAGNFRAESGKPHSLCCQRQP